MKSNEESVWRDVKLVTETIANSNSIKELLVMLGLSINTYQYKRAKRFSHENEIALPSMAHSDRAKLSNTRFIRIPNEEIFRNFSPYERSVVKARVIEDGLIPYECHGEVCQIGMQAYEVWDGLVLQLEHKNGDSSDNRLENLEFLCPNCHSLTPTYAGGNAKRYENGAGGVCISCNRRSKQKQCYRCKAGEKRSLSSISIERIASLINEKGMDGAASYLGTNKIALSKSARRRLKRIAQVLELEMVSTSKHASNSARTANYPPIEDLILACQERGFASVAREVGVSNQALRAYIRRRNSGELPKSKFSKRRISD